MSAWREATRFAYLIEPPFNDRDVDGRITGCGIELARTGMKAIGGVVEFVETALLCLLPGLVEGRWRMTTGVFATEERRRSVAFTRPIWALADGLLVATGDPLSLTG